MQTKYPTRPGGKEPLLRHIKSKFVVLRAVYRIMQFKRCNLIRQCDCTTVTVVHLSSYVRVLESSTVSQQRKTRTFFIGYVCILWSSEHYSSSMLLLDAGRHSSCRRLQKESLTWRSTEGLSQTRKFPMVAIAKFLDISNFSRIFHLSHIRSRLSDRSSLTKSPYNA